MPVPKKKTPKSRLGKRRSHLHMRAFATSECPQCHRKRLPHRACPYCGFYRGREAVTVTRPELPS